MKRAATILILTLALAIAGVGTSSAATSCPSFHVLHNDQIGDVKIAAGMYSVKTTSVSCKNSTTLIARFLGDYDGKLQGGWLLQAKAKTVTFAKPGTTQKIVMSRGYSPSGGGSDRRNGACPGTFTVLHNDQVGKMKLKAGQYKITTNGLYCWFDASKLAYFLNYTESSKLPSPWTVDPMMMKIQRSPNHYFTLRYLGNAGGGGSSIPGMTRCSSKLKIATAAKLAGIDFVAGSHFVNVAPGTTCAGAAKVFNSWLANGAVSNNWKVNSQTATFTYNAKGFQVEPAV